MLDFPEVKSGYGLRHATSYNCLEGHPVFREDDRDEREEHFQPEGAPNCQLRHRQVIPYIYIICMYVCVCARNILGPAQSRIPNNGISSMQQVRPISGSSDMFWEG